MYLEKKLIIWALIVFSLVAMLAITTLEKPQNIIKFSTNKVAQTRTGQVGIFEIENVNAKTGEEGMITIWASGPTGRLVGSLEVYIKFNPNDIRIPVSNGGIVDPKYLQIGKDFTNWTIVVQHIVDNNNIKLALYCNPLENCKYYKGDKTKIANITFQSLADSGTQSDIEFADNYEKSLVNTMGAVDPIENILQLKKDAKIIIN